MSMSEGYTQAIEKTGAIIAESLKPFWAVARRTSWADDFLGTMFKWGCLCSDVPCAIIPRSASPNEVLHGIHRIITQESQNFPLLRRYLWHICRRRCPPGLSGFQANVATNLAISELLGDGFVAFLDEARLYPQHARKYVDKLDEFWPGWIAQTAGKSSLRLRQIGVRINAARLAAEDGTHLTPSYHIRASRAQAYQDFARAYEEREIKPIRKWLAQKYPHLDWNQWHGNGYFYDARELLDKVYPYIEHKDSYKESRKAWSRWQAVNEERLSLWREWYHNWVRLPLKALC